MRTRENRARISASRMADSTVLTTRIPWDCRHWIDRLQARNRAHGYWLTIQDLVLYGISVAKMVIETDGDGYRLVRPKRYKGGIGYWGPTLRPMMTEPQGVVDHRMENVLRPYYEYRKLKGLP